MNRKRGLSLFSCFPAQSLAADVLERLIEATYAANPAPPLTACNLALEKMRHFVRLSHDLHYLDARRYEFAARALDETGR